MKPTALINRCLMCAALVLPLPVLAQAVSFQAEIDCGGIVIPGDSVPYTMDFENETSASIALDGNLTIDIPNLGTRTLRERSFTLAPNQVVSITKQLNLPGRAPNGRYVLTLTTSSADETTFDTCSFHVQ